MRRLFAPLVTIGVLGIAHCSSAERVGGENLSPSPGDGAATPPPGTASFGEAGAGDAGQTACTEDVDVVLVLDVSSSMGFVLDQLGSDIDGVVTASNALKPGAHFGLVIYVDNAALSSNGDQENGKVHTTAATLKTAFATAESTYTEPNRNPGDGPTGPTLQNPICEENALDALYMAATDFPWRASAARVVILATDDTFIEKPDNYGDRDHDGKEDKTNYPREGDYPAKYTLDETVTALKSANIRVFSFSAMSPPGFLEGCGTGRRFSDPDAYKWGWSQPYQGKPPIPNATDGKNFDLGAVRSGKLSLATTINEVVLQSHCAGPPK
jgi:hypothetical protein